MKAILALALLTPSLTFAHGSVPHQAADAIEKAVETFEATQTQDTRRLFQSISANKTGHEQFAVTIGLRNGATIAYSCQEDESVNPVVWNCR